MKIDGPVALVTVADRELGRAYARELVSPAIPESWDSITS